MGCVGGVWKAKGRERLSLGVASVSCLLAVSHEMWAACESSIHIISVAASSSSLSSNKLVITKVCFLLIKRCSLTHSLAKVGPKKYWTIFEC